jgi:hypothetical protein
MLFKCIIGALIFLVSLNLIINLFSLSRHSIRNSMSIKIMRCCLLFSAIFFCLLLIGFSLGWIRPYLF